MYLYVCMYTHVKVHISFPCACDSCKGQSNHRDIKSELDMRSSITYKYCLVLYYIACHRKNNKNYCLNITYLKKSPDPRFIQT